MTAPDVDICDVLDRASVIEFLGNGRGARLCARAAAELRQTRWHRDDAKEEAVRYHDRAQSAERSAHKLAVDVLRLERDLAAAKELLVHLRCDTGETWEDECMRARRERDKVKEALTRISAIRDDIIGRQSVNWSAHIYPLVAALGDAGFEGVGYDVAREKSITAESDLAAAVALLEDWERDDDCPLAARTRAFLDALAKRGGT